MKGTFQAIAFSLLLTASTSYVQAQAIITNGLIAYYPLNGTLNDASGNGHNGVLNGAALTSTTNQAGITNGAFHFGGNSYISVTPTPFLVSSNWTISFWWTLDAGNNNPNNLVSTGSDAGGGVDIRYVGSDSQQWQLIVNGNESALYFNATNNPNNWNMWTCTKNGQAYQQFLNGTLVNANTVSGPPTDAGSLWFGQHENGNNYNLNGSLGDILVYNRALSSNEIQQLYMATLPPCLTPQIATATATVVNGFVVGATITDSGCGYTNTPLVLIVGGGGTGATAVANVTNGVVTGLTITDAGIDYTSIPTIYIYNLPSINLQPQPVVVNAFSLASFNVNASGTPPLGYQWSLNGTNIVNDGTNIWGATSNTLTISNVVQTNLGIYAVVVTNAFGSITSSNATLAMYPFIETPFTGGLAYWGQSPTFSIQALGTGPLSYQWFDNGVAIPNATNQTLSLPSIQITNSGLYTVVISNLVGSVTNTPEQVVVEPSGITLGFSPTVTITGVAGYNYVIQNTTNLADTNSWVTVTNLTLTQPVQIWTDTNVDVTAPINSTYFYRVLPGQ